MIWTELHASLMTQAFENVLGIPGDGSMAFVRCLTPDVVNALTGDLTFSPKGWAVWRVSDVEDAQLRTITADQAVELREKKEEAILLLVDTDLAGAGMDGIYSAAREIDETTLFTSSLRSAYQSLAKANRHYVEQAIKKARGFGNRFNVSPWTEFDFLARIARDQYGLCAIAEWRSATGPTSKHHRV